MADLNPPQVPFLSVGGDFESALLQIVVPQVDEKDIPLKFNPASYQLKKSNNFSEIEIPGLQTPPIQYIRGGSETLSFDALLDTSDSMKNVRDEYVEKIARLLRIDSELHAPPIVRFVWESTIFQGVVTEMTTSYVLFTPEGVPLRAEVSLSLTSYCTVEEQVSNPPRNSTDVEKSLTFRRGDRLEQIASGVYQDPARWREIARKNGIRDPRRIEPGHQLLIPRITGRRRRS